MSEATIIAITAGTTLATLVLSRIRCLFRPCDPSGQYCQSGCTEHQLDKDDAQHEVKIEERNLNGRDVLVCHSND